MNENEIQENSLSGSNKVQIVIEFEVKLENKILYGDK